MHATCDKFGLNLGTSLAFLCLYKEEGSSVNNGTPKKNVKGDISAHVHVDNFVTYVLYYESKRLDWKGKLKYRRRVKCV